MDKIRELIDILKITIGNGWGNIDWNSVKFARKEEAILTATIFAAILLLALLVRVSRRKTPGRTAIVLPALLSVFKKSNRRFLRCLPLVLFFLGLPSFFIALADPYIGFVRENVIYSGKRIAILLDASSSMSSDFTGDKLKKNKDMAFFAAASAAEYFMKLRIKGGYKDLMALIEFGNEPYVITPFTNDYQNILTSIRLVSDPDEWMNHFPDKDTRIITAINQSVGLFKIFGFLNATGNLIVLFSDGIDNQVEFGDLTLDQILAEAQKNKIPIFFIRTRLGVGFEGKWPGYEESDATTNDALWKNAVEKTGGKFFVAANEGAIIKALRQIDQEAVGAIVTARYSEKQPLFSYFVLISLVFWVISLLLVLFFKFFRKFP